MYSSRKGQANASSAAILIALIGLAIVVYILTLPPDARDELLYGTGGPGPGTPGGSGAWGGGQWGGGGAGPLLILVESPGTLRLQTSPHVEHNIPSTTVFASTSTVVVKELSSLRPRNSLFSQQGATFTFNTQGLLTDRLLLSFNVDQARGDLIILLNGQVILDQIVRERSPQPILLPNNLLVEGENEITFLAGDVGFRFWANNEYQIRNILVSADAVDLRGTISEQTFNIPEQEFAQLEFAQLVFRPECDPQAAGRLVVQMNHRMLYSGYPDCGVLNQIDVAKETLRAGTNNLIFVSEEGNYLLDNIRVVSHLVEQGYPLYYFNLPLDLYEPLDFGDNQLLLTMRFADYRPEKRGEIIINGFVQSFGTQGFVYQAGISPNVLLPGPNTIQVIPHVSELNVAELKIEMI